MSQKGKSERQVKHERVSSKFAINISVNAMIGIMLAVLGTFILFFNGTTGLMLVRIIGVVAAALGAVAVVNYFRYKNSGKSLALGIIEIIVGVALVIAANQISSWIFFALGLLLVGYGIYLLVKSKGNRLNVLMAIIYLILGAFVILYMFGTMYGWEWITSWGYIPIGIAAYLGAIFFLFM